MSTLTDDEAKFLSKLPPGGRAWWVRALGSRSETASKIRRVDAEDAGGETRLKKKLEERGWRPREGGE